MHLEKFPDPKVLRSERASSLILVQMKLGGKKISRINHNTVRLIYLFINRSWLHVRLYTVHSTRHSMGLIFGCTFQIWAFLTHYMLFKLCLNVVWGLAHDILWGHHHYSAPLLSLMKSQERASTCRPHHAHLKATCCARCWRSRPDIQETVNVFFPDCCFRKQIFIDKRKKNFFSYLQDVWKMPTALFL